MERERGTVSWGLVPGLNFTQRLDGRRILPDNDWMNPTFEVRAYRACRCAADGYVRLWVLSMHVLAKVDTSIHSVCGQWLRRISPASEYAYLTHTAVHRLSTPANLGSRIPSHLHTVRRSETTLPCASLLAASASSARLFLLGLKSRGRHLTSHRVCVSLLHSLIPRRYHTPSPNSAGDPRPPCVPPTW